MAQPDGGDIGSRTAGSRRRLKADHSILAAVPFRPFYAKLMKALEIVLIHFRYDRSRFDFFQKSSK